MFNGKNSANDITNYMLSKNQLYYKRKTFFGIYPYVMMLTYACIFLASLITRMLQRDPKRRASLEEIENHPWLQGVDPSPATKYNIPLVSYKNLSEEEHNSIIQRMVLGDIADRDTIVE